MDTKEMESRLNTLSRLVTSQGKDLADMVFNYMHLSNKVDALEEQLQGLREYISNNLSPTLREIENNLERNKGTKHKDDI